LSICSCESLGFVLICAPSNILGRNMLVYHSVPLQDA
jgi:hypothetical protein